MVGKSYQYKYQRVPPPSSKTVLLEPFWELQVGSQDTTTAEVAYPLIYKLIGYYRNNIYTSATFLLERKKTSWLLSHHHLLSI